MNFGSYQTGDFYDELFRSAETPREEFRMLVERIDSLPEGELLRRQRVAERDLMHMGITFNVYGDERGQERIFPFDLVPRLVTSHEWDWLEKGLQQRVRALNLFIDDVYHDQKIVKDRIIPQEIIRSAQGSRRRALVSTHHKGFGATSQGPTSSATVTEECTCWKTTYACPRGSHTFSRIVWS